MYIIKNNNSLTNQKLKGNIKDDVKQRKITKQKNYSRNNLSMDLTTKQSRFIIKRMINRLYFNLQRFNEITLFLQQNPAAVDES